MNIILSILGIPGCVTGDTLVTLSNGKNVEIRKLGKKHLQKINVKVRIRNEKTDVAKVFHYYKKQPILEIITEPGTKIKGTYNHPLLRMATYALCLKYTEWARLDNLKIGDLLVTEHGTEKIVSIKPAGNEDVYDLEIPKSHEFIANGIISHNTGKSYAGIYLGKYVGMISGVEFPDSSKNIVFTYQEFLNIVKGSRAKETIVQDEQRVLGVGFGSRSLSEEIQDIERVIRKRQNNMIYIAPTLESHLHIGILEPTGINYELGVCRLMFYDNKEIPRGKVYTLMPNKTILENYGKRKDAFIEKMVNRNMGDQYEEMERILQNLLTDDQFQALSNKAKRVFHIAKKYPTLPAQMHEWLADLAVVTNE